MSTAPWNCVCGRKNSYRAEFCQTCGNSWSWSFSSAPASSTSRWHDWQDPPKTPKPRQRSQSRSRSKGKGATKGKQKGGKADPQDLGGYSASDGQQPWQRSSVLATMGITPPGETPAKTSSASTQKDPGMDQVLQGLRAHLKSMGQEISPEVEKYLTQKAGSTAQTIKMASQQMEAAQKATTRLKAELAQQSAIWKKFQEQIAQEYETQLAKFQERQSNTKDGLKKAEEDFQEAKRILQAATQQDAETVPIVDELQSAATVQTAPGMTDVSPKRKTAEKNPVEENTDPLAKKLRQQVEVVSDDEEKKPFP